MDILILTNNSQDVAMCKKVASINSLWNVGFTFRSPLYLYHIVIDNTLLLQELWHTS